jgi:hypothetical protein
VGFLPFFPTAFGLRISMLLSAAAPAEDRMLAKDKEDVAAGPAQAATQFM